MPVVYSRGTSIRDNMPTQRSVQSFAGFVAALDADRAPDKRTAPYVCGPFNGEGRRRAEGVLPVRFLAVDIDKIDADLLPELRIWFTRFSGCAWPTHSSRQEAPRERVFIELSREATRDECIRIGTVLAGDLTEEFGDRITIDPSTFRPEQPVFVPPVDVTLARFDGEPLDVDGYLRDAPAKTSERTQGDDRATDGHRIPEGRRNVELTRIGGKLRHQCGLSASEIEAALLQVNRARCDPPLGDAEVGTIARSVGRYETNESKGRDELSARAAHLPEHWEKMEPPARPAILKPYSPRRAASVIVGAGASSKTLVLCEWTAAITTGTDWRGHPVIEGDVVIVTWEDVAEDYHGKLYSLLQARPELMPYADRIRERLHFLQMHGSGLYLVAPADRGRPAVTLLPHRIVDHIKRNWPETVQVFIETVSRANATDETNEAMAMIVAAGEVIAHELDAGVTAVHHVSKAAAAAGVVDATAGRGGTALPDNCRATTVVALLDAESPPAKWPPGFQKQDFEGREVVLVANPRSSYARRAKPLYLERVYPAGTGAPYLRAIAEPERLDAERRDGDADKLLLWFEQNLDAKGMTERAIRDRSDQIGLGERKIRSALARLVKAGRIVECNERQYGDKGKLVIRHRLPRHQQKAGL